jgi:hypothetical protein
VPAVRVGPRSESIYGHGPPDRRAARRHRLGRAQPGADRAMAAGRAGAPTDAAPARCPAPAARAAGRRATRKGRASAGPSCTGPDSEGPEHDAGPAGR